MFSTFRSPSYWVTNCIDKQQIIYALSYFLVVVAFTAACVSLRASIFPPALLYHVNPCCNNVNRLSILHKTSIQKSTIRTYQ